MQKLTDWIYGVDLGDKSSVLNGSNSVTGEAIEGFVKMTPKSVRARFDDLERGTVVIETGTHARWVERELLRLGFDVFVCNPRELNCLLYTSPSPRDCQ